MSKKNSFTPKYYLHPDSIGYKLNKDGDWKKAIHWSNPYNLISSVIGNRLDWAQIIVWYCYRFPFFFVKWFSYQEDLVHEVLMQIMTEPLQNWSFEYVRKTCRLVVARYLAKNVMVLSGYTNMRSWINRRWILKANNPEDMSVITEYEEVLKIVEKRATMFAMMNEIYGILEESDEKYAKMAMDYIDGYGPKEIADTYHISLTTFYKLMEVARSHVLARLEIYDFIFCHRDEKLFRLSDSLKFAEEIKKIEEKLNS